MKKSILLGLGAVAMAMGVGAGLSSAFESKIAETHADLSSTTRKIYVQLGGGSNWWVNGTNEKLKNFPNCHVWKGSETANIQGTRVEASGMDLFSFDIPIDVTHCIFAAWDGTYWWTGNNEQTANIELDGSKDFFTINSLNDGRYYGYWSNLPAASAGTIYFVDGESWHLQNSIKAHYWGGESSSSWPGEVMTETKIRLAAKLGDNQEETEDLYVYKFTLPVTARFVIFNNSDGDGGSQTDDLAVEAGKVYYSRNVANASNYDDLVKLLITINDNMGAAAISVLGGEVKSDTICAIDVDLAGDIIDDYQSLDAGIATAVAKSGINTYTKASGYTSLGTATLPGIVDALADKHHLSNGGVNAWSVAGIGNKDAALGIGLVAAIGVMAAGALIFVAKKRKEN